MTIGILTPADAGEDVRRARTAALLRSDWLPEPDTFQPIPVPSHLLVRRFSEWFDRLDRTGTVKIQLDRRLTDREFIDMGTRLGDLIPETASAVQPFVDEAVILNLRQSYAETDAVDVQPFAENFLTLHTESSLRSLSEQPRYLMFECVHPPAVDTGAQTVLVAIDELVRRLEIDDLDVLRHTGYRDAPESPTFCYERDERATFSFRDFEAQDLVWRHDGGHDEQRVNTSIRSLLLSLYGSELRGIRWSANTLVAFDNTRFFHGRTRASAAVSDRNRHLRRLRIKARRGT